MVVHRAALMPATVTRAGLAVVNLDRSLVDAWSILPTSARRRSVIEAVRKRLTIPSRIRAATVARAACKGAGELLLLLELLERRCHSELEIWGLQRVLIIPGVPRPGHQILVQREGRRAYVDAGWEVLRLGVEFDGAEFHSGAAHREQDRRRDAWLASIGWLIMRFSYARMTTDPEGVRTEIRAAYEIRLHQFGPASSVAPLGPLPRHRPEALAQGMPPPCRKRHL